MRRFHSVLSNVLAFSTLTWLAVAIASIWLMTLGTDEAWNLNGLRSVLTPNVPNLSSELIETSGGLFALGNLFIEWTAGSAVWVHRCFSLVCYLVMLRVVVKANSHDTAVVSGSTTSLVMVAPVLAVPGTAEISTMALGTSAAICLLIMACLAWCSEGRVGTRTAILCGCLCGLAAASRFELILAMPGFLLFAALQRSDHGWRTLRPKNPEILFVVITLVIFVGNMSIMSGLQGAGQLANSTGTNSLLKFLDYPRQLNKVLVLQSFLPFGGFALLTILPFFMPMNHRNRRLSSLLLIIGWILAAAWFFQAPIPHLRYLWPSLVCFALPAGFVLSSVYQAARQNCDTNRSLACLAIASALVLGSSAGSFRSVVMGEQDYLSWEWSREMRADYFRRFQHVKDQKAVAVCVQHLPENADVACYIQPFPLRYLAQRSIVLLADYFENPPARGNRLFLVLSPGMGVYKSLSPESYIWIEQNCRLHAEFGAYSVYEVPVELLLASCERLQPRHREYVGHPLSTPWFGRLRQE
jgi:hypothetical protein